jgi:hypothetical protein
MKNIKLFDAKYQLDKMLKAEGVERPVDMLNSALIAHSFDQGRLYGDHHKFSETDLKFICYQILANHYRDQIKNF